MLIIVPTEIRDNGITQVSSTHMYYAIRAMYFRVEVIFHVFHVHGLFNRMNPLIQCIPVVSRRRVITTVPQKAKSPIHSLI